MFYGSATPHDMEFAQFVIMFRSIYREGFGRPYDGVRRILKHVVRQYKESGGELRLRAGVRAIRCEGGQAVGVVLDDGTELTADCILSSAGAAETMRLCGLPVDAEKSAAAPGEITFVETIASLDCQPADLGHRETIIFYSDVPDFVYDNPAQPCDLRSGIICSPNNFQYEQPLPEGAVRITALANKDYWMNLSEEDYADAKQVWHDRIAASALAHIPDFRPHVIDTDTFTPRTIRKFTGHINGCVYGAPRKRWDGATPLGNLYLCGTDQGYLGIVGSMISGISMANQHVLRQG
jgi:phytoene dehydrogenase-like protein